MFPLPLTVAVAAVVALVAFCIGAAIGRRLLIQCSVGEALVANTIEAYAPQPHVLFNNITLPTGEGTTQIDHVLVAATGIFIIETKHYQGWIFGGPKQEQWTQTIYRKKSRFRNPLLQNYAHLKAIESLFTLPKDNYLSLVVFTGDAEFKSDLGPDVIQLRELPSRLTAERPVLFDERKMTYIVGRIEMKRLRRSLETDEYHLNYVRGKVGRAANPYLTHSSES